MKKYILALLVSCGSLSVTAGEIKAVVGDVPISGYDVTGRAKLMQLQQPSQTQGLTQEELEKKALLQLVDEQIKVQEADKQGFSVSKKDVSDAIERLETQNDMPVGQMEKLLQQAGIERAFLESQVRSDLLWLQILNKHKDMLTPVRDKDVHVKKEALKQELAQPTYLLAEIVVPTRDKAEQVVAQIRRGAVFSQMASQYSVVKSASANGLLGWVTEASYPAQVMNEVRKLKTNEMSQPIQVTDGWIIVLLLDKRTAVQDGTITIWDLAQMATAKNKTVSAIPQIFKLTDCDSFVAFGEKNAITASVRRGLTDPNQLPPELKHTLDTQKTGTPIGPIQTVDGDLFFMKCSIQKQSVLPSDDAIKSMLEMEKMDELSRKLLRQIKRYAVVEYK